MRIMLDAGSNALPYLGKGWAHPEGKHVWAIGQQSWLMLPAPGVRRDCLLSIAGWPHVQPGVLDQQRVLVTVNGHDVGESSLSQSGRVVMVVPRAAIAGKAALCIRLRHPDNARPMDFPHSGSRDQRRLAVAYQEVVVDELTEEVARMAASIRAALDMPPALHTAPVVDPGAARDEAAAAAGQFQSAGDDCEFGFIQRSLGLEPLGLFRFASVSVANLTRGVATGFAGFATADTMEIVEYAHLPEHDYMGRETAYGLYYHTHRLPAQIQAAALKQQEMQRLPFLARKFMEDVANGEHLFVLKCKTALLPEQIAGLLTALRARGPATLLWVRQADPAHPPGSAGWVVPGLMAGYLDRFGVPPLVDLSTACWIALIRSSNALWRQRTENRHGFSREHS
jgi:hypothetical protein